MIQLQAKESLMWGLEVRAGKEQAVIAGFDPQLSVLSAGVSWRQQAPGGVLRGSFNVQGSNERVRHDWRRLNQRLNQLTRNSVVTVRVVERAYGTPPTRPRQRKIDWRQFFRDRRRSDIARLNELECALERVRYGLTAEELFPVKAPTLALTVTLNGKLVERSPLWTPGVVRAAVILGRKAGRVHAEMETSAMERRSKNGWKCWPHRYRSLKLNDVLRFRTVSVHGLERRRRGGHLDGIESSEEALIAEIIRLQRRTATNAWYDAQATEMEKAN